MLKNITDAGISRAEWDAFVDAVLKDGGTCIYVTGAQACYPSETLESCLNCVLADRIDRT
jgi:hypothetical protein